MEDLIVVKYEDEYQAERNMDKLRRLDDDWVVDIHDAVAVSRDADGKLRIRDSYKTTTGEGAGWGLLLGTILGGLALLPFTGGVSAAVANGMLGAGMVGGGALGGATGAVTASDQKEHNGISEDFVSEVSDTIKRGQSAIFALVESNNPNQVAGYFRGTGGEIIRTSLSPYEQERIQQILSDSC